MRRTLRRLSLLTLALAATACGGDHLLPDLGSRDPARHKEVWDRAQVTSYDFTYSRTCDCEDLGEVRVFVRGGNVYHVESLSSGQQLPHDRWDEVPTVNDVFAQLIEAHESGEKFQALYEARLRYPVAAIIGDIAAGGGIGHQIHELEPYEGPWYP